MPPRRTIDPVPPAEHLPEDDVACNEPTFAVAVSHCPWRADRSACMARMRPILHRPGVAYVEITERAPNHVWSRHMWGWGLEQRVSHVVFLQDDLTLAPEFWPALDAMVRAQPRRVLALISNHPYSPRFFTAGLRWFRMSEVLGTGYVFPIGMLHEFIAWRDALPWHRIAGRLNEDFAITNWQYRSGRRAWCPVPTIIQTATQEEVGSTNPDVAAMYPFRTSYLDWRDAVGVDLASVDEWRPTGREPDLGFDVCCRTPERVSEDGIFVDLLPPSAEIMFAHETYMARRRKES